MTVQSPSRHDPEKRARLIQSAATLFSRVGFESARVDEIAAGAQVAKGTVYLYFDSKAHLFRAVLSELASGLEASASDNAGASPESYVRTLIRSQVALAKEAPDLFRCYVSALFGVNRDFQAFALGIFEAQSMRVARALASMANAPRTSASDRRRASLFVASVLAAALVRGLEGGSARSSTADEASLMALIKEPAW
jgi:AcrR family transcriptional regulator